MCLIVDINVAHKVLLRRDDRNFSPVHRALFAGLTAETPAVSSKSPHNNLSLRKKATCTKLVYGGKLTEEYRESEKLRRIVLQLQRAGRATHVSDEIVNLETQRLVEQEMCLSNDPHLIALARRGNVRLLCTEDKDLIKDFHDKRLLDKPRGKVYSDPRHQALIGAHCACFKKAKRQNH